MKLKKTSYTVSIAGAASERLSGRKMVLLADFHNGDPGPVLAMLYEDMPDVILIPGDVVLGYLPEGNNLIINRCRNIIPFLEGCAGIAPTYVSVGNHECLLCNEDLDALKATGITLLDNEWTEITFREEQSAAHLAADRILAGGLTSAHTMSYRRFRDQYNRDHEGEYVRYPYRRRPRDIAKYPSESAWLDEYEKEEGYRILLCHHPEYWCIREPMLKDRDLDLVLSGHAHGGQWQFFGRGIYAPGQGILPRYTCGMHYGPYGRMIISRGLNNPYRSVPRWGNPCEIVYCVFRDTEA